MILCACQFDRRFAGLVRSGLTLVEMVVSLAVVAIIMAVLGSVTVVMLRTASLTRQNSSSPTDSPRATVDQITDDLKLALSLPEQSATAITMTVPDRDGDGQAETIRYAWSGVAGDPLTRQYNNGAAVAIASNIGSFNVRNVLKTVGPPAPSPPVETAEGVLIWSDTMASLTNFGIKASNKASQFFRPSLPPNALSWKITRIKARVMRNGSSSSNIQMSIYLAGSSGLPTGTPLDSGTVSLTTIGINQTAWVEIPFTNLTNLTPGQGLCLVATSSTGQVSYYVWYTTAAGSYPGAFSISANRGPWTTPDSSKALQFYVYGMVTIQP